jgi:large subunit ribosomal protein L19
MTSPIIQEIEKNQCKTELPTVEIGDTVVVHKIIIEGKKQRVQKIQGTVIKISGTSSRLSFTVRKIVQGEGVETTFLTHSTLVEKVEIIQRAKVRRAKLYYLRDKVGAKNNRLKVRKEK